MQFPRRLMLLFSLIVIALAHSWFGAQAQTQIHSIGLRPRWGETRSFSAAPSASHFSILPVFRPQHLVAWPLAFPLLASPSFAFPIDGTELLRAAIVSKLGEPYRLNGTGERGYDCSGFVWRAFQDAGVSFERAPARDLWDRFRAATEEESRQFGTLVFFNDLKHVGIVRDAFSFYHASSSQGVVLSPFAGYWGERITGFRRAPLPGQSRIENDGQGGEELGQAVKTSSRPRRVSPPGASR